MIERNIARIALPKMLVGLFVAPFADYGEYERWNSNAHTSCFGVRMPQASEVAVSRSRNGQYHFGFPLWIRVGGRCLGRLIGIHSSCCHCGSYWLKSPAMTASSIRCNMRRFGYIRRSLSRCRSARSFAPESMQRLMMLAMTMRFSAVSVFNGSASASCSGRTSSDVRRVRAHGDRRQFVEHELPLRLPCAEEHRIGIVDVRTRLQVLPCLFAQLFLDDQPFHHAVARKREQPVAVLAEQFCDTREDIRPVVGGKRLCHGKVPVRGRDVRKDRVHGEP